MNKEDSLGKKAERIKVTKRVAVPSIFFAPSIQQEATE